MQVNLQPFDFNAALARAGLDASGNRIQGTQAAQAARQAQSAKAVGGTSFGDAMSAALKDVSQTQNSATEMQRQVQLDNPNVSLEDTMVAVQKAQIGFQAVLQVRNRLVSAYSEIMNMQV